MTKRLDGKLCKKLIHSELPHWIILKMVHHDDNEFKLDLEFVNTLADTNLKTYKAWLKLRRPTIKQRFQEFLEHYRGKSQ
jgi:hypothetical protein